VALAEPGALSYALAVALIALGYHLASRLAYVLYIGTMLRRQERSGYFTGRYGAEAGFRRFRRAAFLLMSNDAVSFVVLCLVSRRTLGQPSAAAIAAGVLLLLVGIATKLWAAATLGGDAYYWRNFFALPCRWFPPLRARTDSSGIRCTRWGTSRPTVSRCWWGRVSD